MRRFREGVGLYRISILIVTDVGRLHVWSRMGVLICSRQSRSMTDGIQDVQGINIGQLRSVGF
jgi:hypothetical protein